MKTAVSIPDPVFAAAEELAARLGVSRSRLYARALSAYLEGHSDRRITERLDEVYAEGSVASEPGSRRPLLVVQADSFNRSRIQTVLAVVLTTNLARADAPGNVYLAREETGLPKDSVANVSQIVTAERRERARSHIVRGSCSHRPIPPALAQTLYPTLAPPP